MMSRELKLDRLVVGLAILAAGIATLLWPAAVAFELPTVAQWIAGWLLVGFGGSLIPNRTVAGMIIGYALAFETLTLLVLLK